MKLYDDTEVTPMKLIKNAHVYAPEDLGVQDILICSDRILAVRDHIDPVWEDTEIIDAAGNPVADRHSKEIKTEAENRLHLYKMYFSSQ